MDPDDLELEPLTKTRNPMQALVTGTNGRTVPTAAGGPLNVLSHLPGLPTTTGGDTEAQIRGSYLYNDSRTTTSLYASIYRRSKQWFMGCTMLVLSVALTALVLSIVFWEKRPIDLNGPVVDLSLDRDHRWYIGPTGDYFKITTDPTLASSFLAIHKDGNVGLSDDAPTTRLSLVDNIAAAIKMRVVSGALNWYVGARSDGGGSPPSDFFRIGNDATLDSGAITIDVDGNVGLNTAAPTAMLHIGGTQPSSLTVTSRIDATVTMTADKITSAYTPLRVYTTINTINAAWGMVGIDNLPNVILPESTSSMTRLYGYVFGTAITTPASATATISFYIGFSAATSTFVANTDSTTTITSYRQFSTSGITKTGTGTLNIGDFIGYYFAGLTPSAYNVTNIYGVYAVQPSGATGVNHAMVIGGTAGTFYMGASTSNMMIWRNVGFAAPTLGTRSAGTKVVLFEQISSTDTDYALGIETSHMWLGVPAFAGFKWYSNTTEIARLNSVGGLGLGTAPSTGNGLVVSVPSTGSGTVENVRLISSMTYVANSQILRGLRSGFTFVLDAAVNRTGLVAEPLLSYQTAVAAANIGTTLSRWTGARFVGTDWTLNTGSATTITTLDGMRIENPIGTITGTGSLTVTTKNGLFVGGAASTTHTTVNYYAAYLSSSSTAATTINVGLAVEQPGGSATTRYAIQVIGGANVIQLDGSTSNMIQWRNAGLAAPTLTTSSAGTKLMLWPGVSATAVDYAIGVESGYIWNSVPATSSSQGFKWYANMTEVARLTATGGLQLPVAGGTVAVKSTAGSGCVGSATLNGSGTVTVATTCVATGDYVFFTATTLTNPGFLRISAISNGVSFTITSSSGTDASVVNWWIVKPIP